MSRLLPFLILLASVAYGQSKKEIKKYTLKTTTVTSTDYIDGQELTRTESTETYDKYGKALTQKRTDSLLAYFYPKNGLCLSNYTNS